jgi:hypothetical protein
MSSRTIKLLAFTVCSLIALLLVGVSTPLLIDYIQYQKVEITSALLRDGKYNPALHFTFDRACVFPPESGLAYTWLTERGYRELDKIFPDTFTNWTLVLIDDNKKTFRTLYVLEPSVKFGGGIICNSKITLETVTVDGQTTAYVKEANAH